MKLYYGWLDWKKPILDLATILGAKIYSYEINDIISLSYAFDVSNKNPVAAIFHINDKKRIIAYNNGASFLDKSEYCFKRAEDYIENILNYKLVDKKLITFT